jgi:hypothetical protein
VFLQAGLSRRKRQQVQRPWGTCAKTQGGKGQELGMKPEKNQAQGWQICGICLFL